MLDYEAYQLRWMLEHGKSIRDLITAIYDFMALSECDNIIDGYFQWEAEEGFGSEIWACQSEWEKNEGEDANV